MLSKFVQLLCNSSRSLANESENLWIWTIRGTKKTKDEEVDVLPFEHGSTLRKRKQTNLVELTSELYGTASLRSRTALASICSPNMAAASQLSLYLNPVITVTRIVSFESRRFLREQA